MLTSTRAGHQQLCATGTVGIAATGFALGRTEAQSPACSSRRRPLATTSQLARSVDLSSRSSSSPRFSDATDSFPSRSTVHPVENRTAAPQPTPGALTGKQSTAGTGLRPRRRTYVAPTPKRVDDLRGEPSTPSSPQRPSSSWLARLSTITSSLDESQASGSCPQTPSTHSPTAPFFPSYNVTPNPNKLVKRSTSQSHTSVRIPATPAVLRRPATSRQRSAAMRERSATDSRVDRNSTDPIQPANPFHDSRDLPSSSPTGEIWKPFFGSGRPCPERRSGRRVPSARHRNRSPRRLVPDLGSSATLLLAPDITPESPLPQDYAESLSSKNMTRPVSCGFMEARHGSPNFPSHSAPAPEGERPGKHHTFSVEEKIAGACPSKFKTSEASARPHSAVPASRGRSIAASAHDFARPIKQMFQENSSPSHRQRVEASSTQRPKTAAIGGPNLDQHNSLSNAEGFQRCSLRRVPSFVELRSESRLQETATPPSVQQTSTNYQLSFEQQAGTRISSGSSGPTMASGRSQRHSAATSDPSSTIAGSDNDIKVFSSGEEDETDFQSDTAFDSFSTRAATGSKCSHRGPRIDTIFDPPHPAEGIAENPSAMEKLDLNSTGSLSGRLNNDCGGLTDVPAQFVVSAPNREGKMPLDDGSRPFVCSVSAAPEDLTISAPILEDVPDRSSFVDTQSQDLPSRQIPEERNSRMGLAPRANPNRSQSPATLSGRCEGDAQKSIFEWSEQQHCCKDGDANSRPRTANPKQVLDTRDGRSASRGPSNSLHLRSQSVPISRENSKSTESLKSTKFGTWTLGNKGVSEDWDGDFEFDDLEPQVKPASGDHGSENIDTLAVKVPKSIMERQETLHGQFGHVQELTVLVEELKRLRIRAKELHVLEGPSSELWREAQGIVNLATSDDEGDEDKERSSSARQASPSSTSSDDSDLDWAFESREPKPAGRRNSYSKRSPLSERINPAVSTMPPLRTERVLDGIYQQRDTHDRNTVGDLQQKMAFDTQSLRDLAVRAGVVTRALKDVVRRAEGVCVPDENDPSIPDPPFRKIFARPPESSVTLAI